VAAAAYLMKHAGVTALVVVDDDHARQPVGIITEADIVQAVADGKDVNDLRIRALMTTHPTVINAGTSIRDAARSTVTGHFRHLPVVGEAGLIGMVDITDVCAAVARPTAGRSASEPRPAYPGTARTRQDSPNPRTTTAIRPMNTPRNPPARRSHTMTATMNQTIQPQFRTIDGLSIRFAESEDRGDHALLLNPWPESLFAFEPIWARLAEHAHLVAVDLPGFGHSERRDDLLSPQAMGEFVIRLVDALGLENPHAVGPDIGTSALLLAAAAHPGRLRSLVIGSGGAAYPIQLTGVLKEWIETPDLEGYRSIDPRQIVAGAMTYIERYALPDSVREDYLSSYEGDRFVESMRYVRAYPADLPVLRDLLPEIQTPVQIINGARDPVVPLVNAKYLHERLPQSNLDLLDAGHFAWEDAADEYAALVTSWWAGGYATAGTARDGASS